MTSLLPYVPELYPDETFYSFFARYRRDLRLGQERACRDLFGKFKFVSPYGMQGGLEQVAKRIHPRRNLTAERLIREATPYNYYATFADCEKATFALRQLTCGDDIHAPKILSMRQSPLGPPTHLQLCLECCREAQQNYSDLYWRRSHQLPGVLICPIHGSILLKSPVETCGSSAHHSSFALSDAIVRQSSPVLSNIEPESFDILVKLSKDSMVYCAEPPTLFPQEFTKTQYRYFLRRLGFASASLVSSAEVIFLFLKYLEPIAFYFPELRPGSSTGKRLNELWTVVPRSIHPILHILFRNFLDDFPIRGAPLLNDDHGFGAGPWPCLNPLAEHSGERRLNQLVLHEYGMGRDTKAAFRCPDCGYTYLRTKGSEKIEAMDLGEGFDKRLAELVAAKAAIREMELVLHVSRERIYSASQRLGLNLAAKISSHRMPLREAKDSFRALLARYPDAFRSEIRSKNQRLFKHLHRDAPDWLNAQLPPSQRTGNRRDWRKSDDELAVIVVKRAAKRRSQVPPKQITMRYLLGTRGWHARAAHFRTMLPRSSALLDELAESREDYFERRLTWAVATLKERGVPLTKTRLRQLTGAPPAGPTVTNPIA